MSQGEKPAYQSRSRITRQKIVAALEAALKEKPFDQVSVAEIAARAGVAVGTVYRRFENKNALIPVLLEIYRRRVEEWIAGTVTVLPDPDADLRLVLRQVTRMAWGLLTREAHLLRAVHLYARLRPELVDDGSWDKYQKASYDSIRLLFDAYKDQIRRKDIRRASDITAYMLNTVFLEKGLYPEIVPAAGLKYSGKTLADEIADMIYAWLQLPDG